MCDIWKPLFSIFLCAVFSHVILIFCEDLLFNSSYWKASSNINSHTKNEMCFQKFI